MSPKGLHKLIHKLSEQQRNAVKEIGFGSLLQLKLSECHGQLSRYLVQQYDYCSTTLLLQNKKKIGSE